MSENAPTTQTLLSNASSNIQQSSGDQPSFDHNSVTQCLKFVNDYEKGIIPKGEALLEIQQILQKAISESQLLTQQDFKPGFVHFLDLLDSSSKEPAHNGRSSHVENEPSGGTPELPGGESVESASDKERSLRKRLQRQAVSEEDESDESEDEHEYVLRGKRRKLTADQVVFYPWLDPDQYRHISHRRAEELTLDCYEEWSDDTKYYQGQVTATPGCPSFPLSQWTLLLEGRAPDLEKVLSGHYSTSIDPKQTQSLGKGFEITLPQPITTHKVKTYGDWSITTDLWIEALSFIMPWKESELREYKRYISGFFIDVHYALHTRILNFDKACRLKVEGQKYLHFDAISKFRRLEVSHLSSLGMVAYAELHQLNPKGRADATGRGKPCHNWNRGICDKSATDCSRFHVCSRCRAGHKRTDCPLAKTTK
ncbi:hypothetical protein EDD22DRAFT_785727 [Suillus occidentalis]|nr:hypothetical protein EDD22DRAFT_785727 [Suillus occidentalis]